MTPRVSVVIPVYNEEGNLERLWGRLAPVLRETTGGGARGGAEAIFVDDGSRDGSLEILRRLAREHPESVRVVSFNRNYGQHAAVMAGLEASSGEVVVTMDADLQNPPEEIPKLVAKVDEGFDVVGGWRERREDTWFRRRASAVINRLTGRMLRVGLRDFGCMLRAYRREVVDCMATCTERSTFVPALACKFGRHIAEIPVAHEDRPEGDRSRYSLWKLLKLAADLMTGFSSAPLRLATFFGAAIALTSVGFGLFLGIRRVFIGPENEGVFTLFAILFLLVGGNFLALGIMGEYLGRIYDEVRARPRAVIQETINLPRAGAGAGRPAPAPDARTEASV